MSTVMRPRRMTSFASLTRPCWTAGSARLSCALLFVAGISSQLPTPANAVEPAEYVVIEAENYDSRRVGVDAADHEWALAAWASKICLDNYTNNKSEVIDKNGQCNLTVAGFVPLAGSTEGPHGLNGAIWNWAPHSLGRASPTLLANGGVMDKLYLSAEPPVGTWLFTKNTDRGGGTRYRMIGQVSYKRDFVQFYDAAHINDIHNFLHSDALTYLGTPTTLSDSVVQYKGYVKVSAPNTTLHLGFSSIQNFAYAYIGDLAFLTAYTSNNTTAVADVTFTDAGYYPVDIRVLVSSWEPNPPDPGLSANIQLDLDNTKVNDPNQGWITDANADPKAGPVGPLVDRVYSSVIPGQPYLGPTGRPVVGFSGRGAVEAIPDVGTNLGPDPIRAGAPVLNYFMNFTRTGRHNVWIRAMADSVVPGSDPPVGNSVNDSCHIGVDDEVQPNAVAFTGWQEGAGFTWSREREGVSDPNLKGSVDITTTGSHAISLYMQEDGLIVDKIIITDDLDYVPDGLGPPESPHVPCLPVAENVFNLCIDTLDNDCDNKIDSEDSDCDLKEICRNGIDDDGNNEIDCRDLACENLPECIRENCTNGVDEDTDTRIDCRDSDCADDPACQVIACYTEDWDSGTTAGLSIKTLGWTSDCDGKSTMTVALASALHPGWSKLALDGSTVNTTPAGPTTRDVSAAFRKQIPGMTPGAQSGVWTFECRAFLESTKSNKVGLGFDSGEDSGCSPSALLKFDGSRWSLDTSSLGGSTVSRSGTDGTDRDVDIAITLDYTEDKVTATVSDHGSATPLFTLSKVVDLAKLSELDHIVILQSRNPAGTSALDVDDLTVSGVDCLCRPAGPENTVAACSDEKDNDCDQLLDAADPDCQTLAPKFFRGDADDNGKLELTDAVRILGFLFLGAPRPTCLDAGDADDNGKLELTDAVRILGYLFLGSVAPAFPGPPGDGNACGTDPTPGDSEADLGCESYTKC